VRYPLIVSITVCGSSVGGVIFPIMMDRIVHSLGFGWALRIAGFLNLALLGLVCATVKSRIPPQPQPPRLAEFLKPFTHLSFSLSVVGACLIYLSVFLPYNYVIVQAQEAGMSTNLIQYLVPIMNAAR
jgi:MFS family permease